MKLSEHQREFTSDIAKLIVFAYTQGIELTFGEAYRTEDQQQLYFKGETIEVIDEELELVKVRRKSTTMDSKHLERLAVDFNFFINGELTYKREDVDVLGEYWEALDPLNRWGGFFRNFIDTPHFERNI